MLGFEGEGLGWNLRFHGTGSAAAIGAGGSSEQSTRCQTEEEEGFSAKYISKVGAFLKTIGSHFSQNPLIWIVTINRDPIIFKMLPIIFHIAPWVQIGSFSLASGAACSSRRRPPTKLEVHRPTHLIYTSPC